MQNHQQILSDKFQTTLNKFQQKKNAFISAKRDKKSLDTSDKREKTIGNYFGEYRLILQDKSSNDQ